MDSELVRVGVENILVNVLSPYFVAVTLNLECLSGVRACASVPGTAVCTLNSCVH